ncbi:MAG: 50S ribosomal protein L33 [Candidatus Wallbacteria bacterium]|nr:50S ribosomal protein L33 [Candidatus Wallbacteria bacterium]
MREIVSLECTVCKRKNYTTTRNKKTAKDKLVLKKYCSFDKKHTEHKESKV